MKLLVCESCDAEFSIKHNMDKRLYKIEHCPFCGEQLNEEMEDEVEELGPGELEPGFGQLSEAQLEARRQATAKPRELGAEVMQTNMLKLGKATRRAIEKSGKRALLLSSNSLSHRHFTIEPELPEDMSKEHVTNHNQYIWDMKIINLMLKGKNRELIDIMPDFTEQTMAETDAGSLTWLISALDFPEYEAKIHAYGSVIGTGNAIIGWDSERGEK